MNEKRLKEIQARKAEIRSLLEDTSKDVNIEEINTELDALNAEQKSLEKRAELAKSIEAGEVDPDNTEAAPGADEEEEGGEVWVSGNNENGFIVFIPGDTYYCFEIMYKLKVIKKTVKNPRCWFGLVLSISSFCRKVTF